MKLKQSILVILDRDVLKAIVDNLGLNDVDRRSTEEMAAKLSRTHRATPELLIEYLTEKQVKAVCEEMGVATNGRRNKLIKRLLKQQGKKESQPRAKTGRETEAKNKQRKKETGRMSKLEETPNAPVQSETPIRLPDPPAGMMRVTKTELVWPGKYNEDSTLKKVPRVSLPFQVIETVNESRATRESQKTKSVGLFDVYEGNEGDSFEDGWRNKLIWGDNLLVMGSLLQKYAGRINLIYIDPPFATGADFSFTAPIGDSGEELFSPS